MVLYFTSNVVSPAAFLYMGKDKVESKAILFSGQGTQADGHRDEDLIKFGLEEDVW